MSYILMQFIDKSSGKLCHYIPDNHPRTYQDIADIKAVFKVRQKYKEHRFSFKFFGNEFLIRITYRNNDIN